MGMFRVRCAVSRVPLQAGDAVVAIPLVRVTVPNTDYGYPAISGAPIEGHMNEYGQVIADGFQSVDFRNAMIVNAAVNHALMTDPRLETTELLRGKEEDMLAAIERASETESVPLLKAMLITAKVHINVPTRLPNEQGALNKAVIMEDLFTLQEIVAKVGWLNYADDVFGIPLRTSENDATNLIREEGRLIANVIHDAAMLESPAPGLRGVSL